MVRIETLTTREDAGAIMAVRLWGREGGLEQSVKVEEWLKLEVDVGTWYVTRWDAAGILWQCCATYVVQAEYKSTWRNNYLESASFDNIDITFIWR